MITRMHSILFLLVLLSLSSIPLAIAQSDTSANLRIAFVSNRDGNENIYIMAQDGSTQTAITDDAGRDWNPAWSPDGSLILFNSNRDGRDSLYLMDFNGADERPLFPGESFNDYDGAWSPDGSQIAFVSNRGGAGRELFIADANGSNVRQITDDGKLKGDPVWSPDGREIAYWELTNEGQIWMFRRAIEGEIVQLISSVGAANGSPVWVDDVIYFDTNRDGHWAIYVMQSDGAGPTRVSTAGANSARATLSPDRERIAFVTDRDEAISDEIYVMNVDGSLPRQLTNNGASDHSPAWQPQVPPAQEPAPLSTVAPDDEEATAEAEPEVATGPAVGLSSGVDAFPISKEQLLLDYGILEWHQAGWRGAGQRVGVIDTAFGGINAFEGRFASVTTPPWAQVETYDIDNNRHGTNVLEVVHTVAPDAILYACRYQGTLPELQRCIEWMLDQGVQIINHSVGLPIEPLNGQHEWAQLVNTTANEGVLWVNSAGNFAQSYVTDNFDPDANGSHQWLLPDGSEKPLRITVGPDPDSTYSGTILLSWRAERTIINPVTNLQEQIDLDLEIISAVTGEVHPASSRDDQASNLDAPLFEIAYVQNMPDTFEIRVVNGGSPFPDRIEFSVFVEFAAVDEEWRDRNGSVVAPADASNSLTVGSVDYQRVLASYSSFGAVGTTALKPDVSAPGEIMLSTGPFIGTSAAAPVVAGMGALLLEGVEGMRVDQLKRELEEVRISRVTTPDRSAYGDAIVFMTAPPRRNDGNLLIETPPFTIFPREEEEFVDLGFVCSGTLPTRFEVGIPGYVNYNLKLQIRTGPGEEFQALLGENDGLEFGTSFTVIGGPECNGGAVWWEVELDNGADGWVSEGLGYYLITPDNLERAQLPNTYDTVCPNALDPQLAIGERARVLVGNRFFFRGEAARDRAREQMPTLDANTIVEVLGGPVCEGNPQNQLRWYVRVISGDSDQIGFEGWIAEGGTESRAMVLYND